MRFLSETIVTTDEDATTLTFRLERQRGVLELILSVTIPVFVGCEAYHLKSLVWFAMACIGAFGAVANLLQGNATQMTVTADHIDVRGNVGRMFSTEISIRTADVISLSYNSGGEDQAAGLYARQGRWGNTCVLKNISEDQTNQILNEIFRKFPRIGTGDNDPNSLLFGPGSNLTSLGLSSRD